MLKTTCVHVNELYVCIIKTWVRRSVYSSLVPDYSLGFAALKIVKKNS